MIHYSCIGATGYVCGEVLRMMVNHPEHLHQNGVLIDKTVFELFLKIH